MTDHPRCATCAHWLKPVLRERQAGRLTPPEIVAGEDGKGGCDVAMGPDPRKSAYAVDDNFAAAHYFTAPDHYCPMHSALAPS